MVAYFHLLFNKVLGLDKRADKFVALFALQMAHLVLVYYISDLQLLFFSLELVLLVNKFLPQDALFIIQV